MKRLAIIGVLLVSLLGCQAMRLETGKMESFHPESAGQPEETQGLLTKAVEFFSPSSFHHEPAHPVLPPGKTQVKQVSHRTAKPQSGTRQLHLSADQENSAFDPTASMYVPRACRGNRTQASQMLFNFGLPEENISMQHPEPNAEPEPVDIADALKKQPEDSERFQRLLGEIEKTDSKDWGVDAVEMKRLLTVFRESMDWSENPDLEIQYLAVLRKKVLPRALPSSNSSKAKKNDPTSGTGEETGHSDEELLADERPASKPNKKSKSPTRSKSVEDGENEADDESVASNEPESTTPLSPEEPISVKKSKSKEVGRKTTPSQVAVSHTEDAPHPPLAMTQPSIQPSMLPNPNSQTVSTTPFPTITQLGGNAQTGGPTVGGNPNGMNGNIVQTNYSMPAVQPGTFTQPISGDWEMQARAAAEMLRNRIETMSGGRSFSNEAKLRMLELVLNNRSEAVRPLTSAEKPMNDFWSGQMLGLSALLDEAGQPDPKIRWANSAYRIDEGLTELRRLCPLKLKNTQFVKDWATFGVFLPQQEEVRAGQEIGLYLELENPTIRRSAQGYNVRFSINYEIRDMAANIAQKVEKIPAEETTPSQKRDYCIHLKIRIPKTLSHGQYQLRVSVTDMNHDSLQYAEEQLPLKVLQGAKEYADIP